MADSKITALASIGTGTDPANDPLVIVDVSDVSPGGMSATGTTKKVTLNNLLACSPTATLASATISGDLTVDTSTLKVDSANDRVGIGTATPAAKLIVRDGLNRNLLVASDATQLGYSGIAIGGFTDGAAGYAPLSIISSSTQFGISGSTAMTLNSTGLGVGVVPSFAKFEVNGGASLTRFGINAAASNTTSTLHSYCRITTTGADFYIGTESSTAGSFFPNSVAYSACLYNANSTPMHFYTGGTLRATIDTSGNVGIGVTPSVRLDSLVADAAECARFRAASGWLRIHPYLDATDVCRLQSVNNTNTGLQNLTIEGLNLRFNTNSGNAIIIDNLGNTVSNVNSAVPALSTNNRMVFNLTSNTNLRISVRGSDGVTRVANITLA